MRTISSSLGSIAYPDAICFAFNPTYVKITECSAAEVTIRVSSSSGTYSMNYMAFNGTIVANLSRALQLLFNSYEIIDNRALNAYIEVIKDEDSVHSFNTAVIWGNIAPGETFNGSRKVRWFDNWPQKLSVFDGGNFQDLSVINDSYYLVNPWDYTFDFTFSPAATGTVTFVHDNRRDGVFLRWIDRHGLLQFYLFEVGNEDYKNDEGGQELVFDYSDRLGNSFRNIKRQQCLFAKRTLRLCAPSVDSDEFAMLFSILTSPVVDLFHSGDSAGWVPIRIAQNTIKRTTAELQDFEFLIELPNINAQSL